MRLRYKSIFLTLGSALSAFAIALIFRPYLERTIVLVFLMSVFFSAWISGFWGGLLASLLALPAIDFLFLRSEHAFGAPMSQHFVILAIFISVSLIISRLVSAVSATDTRLKYLLETASDGFWDWNVRTGAVYFSPRWISSLGYEPHEVTPQLESWKRLVHPDDVEKTISALNAHFERRTPIYEVENRLRTKSGDWRWNLDRGKVVSRDENGKPLRMVGVDIDISERKRAEEEASARKAADAANSAKDQFISMVSHELRNPLSTIMTAIEILEPDKRTPEMIDFTLRIIRRSVKHQLMLVNDLLDWSRLRSGKFELNLEHANLPEIIETAWAAVRSDAADKKIAMETRIEPGSEEILADTRRLTQVFWNLFANAVKFTPNGGKISIRSRITSDGVSIAVADSGRGIAPEALPHLFERHWQAQRADASQHGGMGLGRSLVREIVERHGGTVTVESQGPGKGATFAVLLVNHTPRSVSVANV